MLSKIRNSRAVTALLGEPDALNAYWDADEELRDHCDAQIEAEADPDEETERLVTARHNAGLRVPAWRRLDGRVQSTWMRVRHSRPAVLIFGHPAAIVAFYKADNALQADYQRRLDNAKADKSPEERRVQVWIIETLEDRYPAADAAVAAAFEAVDAAMVAAGDDADINDPAFEVDYVAVLLAAIPSVTA